MPRQSLNGDGGNGRSCKVRKRGGSSSSSSSLVRTYRLKRAVLVGKRGGSSTPVPMWKMMDASTSPASQNNANSCKYLEGNGGDRGKEFLVSARKLAATLWEINGVSTLRGKENVEKMSEEGESGRKGRGLKSSKLASNSLPLQLSHPSHSPVSEEMERSKVGSHRRRASAGSEKILQPAHSLQSVCLMEVDEAQPQPHGNSKTRQRLKDVRHGLTTSKELLKVLSRVWGLEEQQATCLSLFAALKTELDRACAQVTKLIQEQKDIDFVLKQFEEEKAVWKIKEQDRIQSSIAGELKTEKKLRKQTERLNKKLGRELADAKASVSKATKELESERRAREILEQVCDELARGIGEDRAEVEELKRESAKVREEVEKEREMLQLADVLREERVQMKLSEAKYEFEEKNAAVDELKTELEAYLKFKRGEEGSESPNYDRIKALEKHLRETLPGLIYQDKEKRETKEEDGDDSADDSDLHSIELNMDDNSKSYEWSNVVYNNSNRTKPGRKSTCAKPPRQSICLERQTSEGIVLEFSAGGKENQGVHSNGYSHLYDHETWKREHEDEIERYNMIKDLRDHIVSASKTTPSQHQTFASLEPSIIAE
ncbi:PREDICTED: uncharacterized protein At5g41620-like isoform X2 [Ipomoea nil]|uniref:uncharacterized protein At5g41620-like isoform X2 n=1 Tax=Ipomoea nil TaxID=35883 RepID=UPI0009013604|nr:PREDICTED: uncharacterized protein At5g41620-like isoform X2 [Ipomoea nil]